MLLFFLSFIAGILTILAPCVLPVLPIIIGGSASSEDKLKPFRIILGLVLSITLFTLLLKGTSLLIEVDDVVWKVISGGIILLFGLNYIFPQVWEKISSNLNLASRSDSLLEKSSKITAKIGDYLIGASLGPVFTSCSPTYFVIVGTVLPVSFGLATVYILAYSFGLGFVMSLVALFGRRVVKLLAPLSNSHGKAKLIIGIIFCIIGISIMLGYDKVLETWLLENDVYGISTLDQLLLDRFEIS